jgi:uncharacterized membrane protein YdjX (TVP38/TMEM64 family)
MLPRSSALRLVGAVALLLVLWLALRPLPLLHWIAEGARAIQGAGLAGALLWFGVVYGGTLLLVPVVPLVVASGWLFGFWGILVALPAAVASATTSFLVARVTGRDAAARALLTRPRAQAVADLAEQGGITTVALLRISPLIPFTPGNAVLGLTGLKLRDLILGTLLGMAPGSALFVWAGSLLPGPEAIERRELPGAVNWVLIGCGLAAAAILAIAAARRLRSFRRT